MVSKAADKLREQKVLLGDYSGASKTIAEYNEKNAKAILKQAEGLLEYEKVLKRITEESKSGRRFLDDERTKESWGQMDRWRKDDIYQDEANKRTEAIIKGLEEEKAALAEKKGWIEEHQTFLEQVAEREQALQEEAARKRREQWTATATTISDSLAENTADLVFQYKTLEEATRQWAKTTLQELGKGRSGEKKDLSESYYVVQRGDTLDLIARRTGVSIASLRRYNDIPGSTIWAGQTLRLTP